MGSDTGPDSGREKREDEEQNSKPFWPQSSPSSKTSARTYTENQEQKSGHHMFILNRVQCRSTPVSLEGVIGEEQQISEKQ